MHLIGFLVFVLLFFIIPIRSFPLSRGWVLEQIMRTLAICTQETLHKRIYGLQLQVYWSYLCVGEWYYGGFKNLQNKQPKIYSQPPVFSIRYILFLFYHKFR